MLFFSKVRILLGYGNVSFTNQATYLTRSTPYSVALVDVNNDSRLDIIVANTGSDSVSVLFGNGNGSFENQMTYSTGSGPQAVAIDDLNNDGWLDIVVCNANADNVGILLHYNTGALAKEISFAPGDGSRLRSLAVDDFNNDNQLDLVVVKYGTNNVGVLLGYGNGSFEQQILLNTSANSHPYSIAIGDYNKDAQLDIAVANYETKNIEIFLGNGNGMFTRQRSYGISLDFSPLVIASSDLNNDDRSEIIVAYNGTDTIDIFYGQNWNSNFV
jgi:hypothetical protein